jgi:RNA polymerase sigma-70 factor, ECF subfamily
VTDSALTGHSPPMTAATGLDPSLRVGALEPAPAAPRMPLDFDSIYDEHLDVVWRTLRRLGVAPESLDDAVQDVFLVVHRRLAEFEARSSVRTWLFGITFRVARDHRRLARRKGGLEPLVAAVADVGPGPFEHLAHSEALRQLDSALSRLDDDKRAVFVMSQIEEMSAPEIADALGIKLNTVYSRLRAARREFEAAVAAQEEARR